MKKFIALALGIIFIATVASAAQLFQGRPTSVISTGMTSSGQAVTGPCAFYGIVVTTDGSFPVTINLYDNTSAVVGTVILPTSIVISGTPRTQTVSFPAPLYPQSGIYVGIDTAGVGSNVVRINYGQ